MGEPTACEYCGKIVADTSALYQHTKAKHGRKAARGILPPREMSLGEELAEAQIAFAMGEAPPEHLLMMFPEAFSESPDHG